MTHKCRGNISKQELNARQMAKNTPFPRENGNTHAAPLYIQVGGRGWDRVMVKLYQRNERDEWGTTPQHSVRVGQSCCMANDNDYIGCSGRRFLF